MKLTALILALVAGAMCGCGTLTALNAGRYSTEPISFQAAYGSEEHVFVGFTSRLTAKNGGWFIPLGTRESITQACGTVAKADVLKFATTVGTPCPTMEVHFSQCTPVEGWKSVALLRIDSMIQEDQNPAVLYSLPYLPYFRIYLPEAAAIQKFPKWTCMAVIPKTQGRHAWGYPAMVGLLPVGLALDVATAPFQFCFWRLSKME